MVATRSETVAGFEGLFSKMLERIRANVNMNLACGESRTVGETTIIPIGVVAYGFGGGMGIEPGASADRQASQEGGGGGGGAWIQPIAIVTVTNGRTKVIPVLDWARVLTGIVGVIGKLILSRGARGRSVFGPGGMDARLGKAKRAHCGKESDGKTDEQEG